MNYHKKVAVQANLAELPDVGGARLTVAFLVNRNNARRRFITDIIFIEQLQFYTYVTSIIA